MKIIAIFFNNFSIVSILLITKFVFEQSLTILLTASSLLLMILGFALRGLISDLFAGMLLSMEKSFKLLEWIQVENYEGQVLETNWRATRLLQRDNNIVSIPNSMLSNNTIINFSQPSACSRVSFGIELDKAIPVGIAKKMIREGLMDALERGRILENPKPSVLVNSKPMGSDVHYTVSIFINYSFVNSVVAISDAVECITSVLERENIHFFNFLQNQNGENAINPTAEESNEDTKSDDKGKLKKASEEWD